MKTNRVLGLFLLLSAPLSLNADNVRIVVGVRGDPDASAAKVKRHGGSILRVLAGSQAVVAMIPLAQLEKLAAAAEADPAIAYVVIDSEVRASKGPPPPPPPPAETVPPGITQIGAPQAWGLSTGAGVKVAVIDTGISLTHPDLAGHVTSGPNFVSETKPPNDDNGHGSHVAGTIGAIDNEIGVVGVAPGTRLYAVKVLNKNGMGWTSDVAAGIDWAAANGMQVANMSLGGGYSEIQDIACANAEAAGVLLIAAAGNSGNANPGESTVGYPAALPSVVAVSAVNASNVIASFSSTGPEVALSAPGVSIQSTWKGSGYYTASGTSMAAPHVAGSAALAIAKGVADVNGNGRSNDEVRALLEVTAEDLGTAGQDDLYGRGLVDAERAVLNAQ